MTYKGGEWMMI